MKKLRLISLILGLLISCSLSSKAQLLIENFDYPVGDSLGQHGWTGHGGTTMLNIIAGNQTYTNYFPSVGNQVYIGTSNNDLSKGFTAVTSGNLYCAFVINVDTAKTTPDYFFHTYSTGAGSSFLNRIYVKDNGDGTVKFGIQKGTAGSGGSAVWTTNSYTKDVPHLVVLKVEIVSGTTNDIPSIFVNPVLNGTEPTADAIATDITSADYTSIDKIAIRQGSANSPGAYFDGLRVATTWADAVMAPAISTETDILTFDLATPAVTGIVDATAHTVALTVPFGTPVTALVPTITVSTGATVSPATAVAQDFTAPVTYTVTAEDGTTNQAWTVTVTVAPASSAKDITLFNFNGLTPAVVGTLDATAHTVALNVPFGTAVTALVPTITVSDFAVVSPATAVAQDFTAPVVYTVTAQDGTTQAWTATVTVAPASSAKDILTFNFDGLTPVVLGTVNATAHTVALTVPFGTAVTALVPTITVSDFATVSPATAVATDFTAPVVYTVTAQDGTTQTWTVTVSVTAGSSAKDILTFNFNGLTPAVVGTVNATAHTVALTVPFGTAVTALVPTITVSDFATVSPATAVAADFTAPVVYTVTAQDGTTQTWTVTVTVAVQTYTVTFSVVGANGTLAATVDAAAITSPATVVAGKNVVFTAAPATNFVVKEWKLDGTVVAGNTTNNYTLSTLAANATVTVEFKSTVGINEVTENVASIYPNPANDVVNVKMNSTINKIAVVNMNGQVVMESLINNNEGSINTSTIANGMYFLRIETANGITMNKIQIVK